MFFFFFLWCKKVTVALKQVSWNKQKNESLLTPPEIKSYTINGLYHSFLTEKQITEVTITQTLS